MKKKIIFLTIAFFYLFAAQINPVQAEEITVAGISAVPKDRLVATEKDVRITKLEEYLAQKQSILADQAEIFIQMSDKYGLAEYDLDFLVPAITGLESSYAKHYPQGSYNAYGWNGGDFYWDSWEESIEHVTRVLRQKYIDRGADTVWKIGPIYAESPTWAQRVAFIKGQIEAFNTEPEISI